jgi:branched-subunit amino acid transport protein
MTGNPYLYILVTGLVSYLIRVLPLTLIRKPIKSRFIRSFLYYVPYVTLTVMTFPAILSATNSVYSGLFALILGIIVAYLTENLFIVALSSCAVVFIIELFIK